MNTMGKKVYEIKKQGYILTICKPMIIKPLILNETYDEAFFACIESAPN